MTLRDLKRGEEGVLAGGPILRRPFEVEGGRGRGENRDEIPISPFERRRRRRVAGGGGGGSDVQM